MKNLSAILAFALLFGMLILGAIHATNAEDQADCLKWQSYAAEFPDFYLTKTEAAQCAYWHIEVNAPVK